MKINIVTGGPKRNIPNVKGYVGEEEVIWIGADRGAYYLIEMGIVPHHAFGDFDSVSIEERSYIQEKTSITIHPPEKDESDLELALDWALKQKPTEITLFGATGGRIDHELCNIQLLLKGINQGICIKMIDCQNEIMLLSPGVHELKKDDMYKYISFISLKEKVIGMSLEGFKYTLENRDVRLGTTLCVSNEFIEKKGTISFLDGIVIVIRSAD